MPLEPESKTNKATAGKKKRSGKFDDSHLTAIPPDEVLKQCPVGNTHHRVWTCPHSDAQRSKGVGDHIVAAALKMQGNDPLGDRGLYPVQIVPVPPKPTEDTFEWVIMPPGELFTGTIYTDGSRLDGKTVILAVSGWAFVAVDDDGKGDPSSVDHRHPRDGSLGGVPSGSPTSPQRPSPHRLRAVRHHHTPRHQAGHGGTQEAR